MTDDKKSKYLRDYYKAYNAQKRKKTGDMTDREDLTSFCA